MFLYIVLILHHSNFSWPFTLHLDPLSCAPMVPYWCYRPHSRKNGKPDCPYFNGKKETCFPSCWSLFSFSNFALFFFFFFFFLLSILIFLLLRRFLYLTWTWTILSGHGGLRCGHQLHKGRCNRKKEGPKALPLSLRVHWWVEGNSLSRNDGEKTGAGRFPFI